MNPTFREELEDKVQGLLAIRLVGSGLWIVFNNQGSGERGVGEV